MTPDDLAAIAARAAAAWEETAAQYARDADYHRGLLDQVAAHLGPAVYVADDGSVMDEPIRAKVPELVAALLAERDAALSRATGAEARAEALREAARECAAWVGAEPQSDEWDGGVRACVGSIADLAEADALAAKGGAR